MLAPLMLSQVSVPRRMSTAGLVSLSRKGRAMMRTLTPITLQEVSFAFAETLFLTASRCISNPAASWRYWALPAAAKARCCVCWPG